ncbi:MAG: hypothetical protein LBQ54_01515 [Planctomycetaceae bacterium]|nr:hypothetical protein [Planctomycetaceae bacterium]
MSHTHGSMPRKDAEFMAWADMMFEQCHLHHLDWKLPAGTYEQFDAVWSPAGAAYAVNKDPLKKNRLTVANKNAAFLTLKRFLSGYIRILKGTMTVPDETLVAMGKRAASPQKGLPSRKPQTRSRCLLVLASGTT